MSIAKSLIAKEVLKVIQQNPRITPAEISVKTEITAQYIRNTLGVLTELKLAKTPVRGIYLITDLGNYVLNHLEEE